MKTNDLPGRVFLIIIFSFVFQLANNKILFSQSQKMAFADWLSTTGSQNYFHKGLTKTDGSGNVYIAGATINGSGNNDILIAKYNSEGVQQWINQYNGGANLEDVGAGCYIDGSGNVYVSGTTQTSATNSDMILIKYNSSGTQQWLVTYNGTGNTFDTGADLYVDGSGNVYMTGSGYNASGNTDIITLKYNSSGVQQWVKYLNYNGNNDAGVKIAPYGSYVIVAVIAQYNTNSYYYGLLQYAMSNGNLAASSITGSSTTNIELVNDMVVDPSGYIYICGSTPVQGQGYDYTLIKLNVNLGMSWERTYNGDDDLDDCAKGLRVDASGNVYVTGYSTTNTEGKNIITLKYNSSGTLQWTEKYNNELDGDDEAYAMAMDNSGNIYVTGCTSTEIDSLDVFTIKYDSDANLIWSVKNDGPYHLNDKSTNIAINNSGEIFIAALSETAPGEYQYLTVKYVEHDIIIPSDYNEEDPNSNFLFFKNDGQIADTDGDSVSDIKFYNNDSRPQLFFMSNSHSLVFSKFDTIGSSNDTLHRIDITFPKGNASAKTYPIEQKKFFHNYYLSQCTEGIIHVYGNQYLVIPEIFENIDLVYSSNQLGIKYYFVVKPGADPNDIEIVFSGADSVKIDGATNSLTLHTPIGNMVYDRPTAYQIDQYNNVDTITGWNCAWQSVSSTCVDLFTSSYNTSIPLIIQIDLGNLTPTLTQSPGNLEWCTHLGYGTSFPGEQGVTDITTDASGNVYAVGVTRSGNFPNISVGEHSYSGGQDIFICKFNNLAESQCITFFGGVYLEESGHIIFAYDKLFVTGTTNSPSLPAPSTNNGDFIQNSNGGDWDGFILSLYVSDLYIKWRTYFGGASSDNIRCICPDYNGHIFIGGDVQYDNLSIPTDNSCSPSLGDFPLCNSGGGFCQSQFGGGGSDGFLAEFDQFNGLIWSTFYGGSGSDLINSIDYIPNGKRLYFSGVTTSSVISDDDCKAPTDYGFPFCQTSGYNVSTNYGNNEGFVGYFVADDGFNELNWTTFFGGGEDDYISCLIANQTTNNIYITGLTNSSTDFPEEDNSGAYYNQPFMGCFDSFIAKFNEYNDLTWSTYIGGETDEKAETTNNLVGTGVILGDIAIDDDGNVYMTGATSPDLPNYVDDFLDLIYTPYPNAYDQDENAISITDTKSYDAFIIAFDPTYNQPFWTTYLGGDINSILNPTNYPNDGDDYGITLSTYENEKLYLGGVSASNSFPLYYPSTGIPFKEDVTPSNYSNYIYSGFISRFNIDYSSFGINEKMAGSNYLLTFPNPANDVLNIKFLKENSRISELKIFDISGTVVYYKNNSESYKTEFQISLSNLVSGCYFIQVISENGKYYSRFIKIE